jgi:peptidoglycan/xylan/chitin deacetylase (PgdA/CDA1 family)
VHSPIHFVTAAIRRAVSGKQRGNVILMYHRIGRTDIDPWGLCVDPWNFSEQMKVLAGLARPVSLEQLPLMHTDHPSVAITFDDGYVDNLEGALPALEQFAIPATIFVSTGYIGNSSGYWWDQLQDIFLSPRVLPSEDLSLSLGGETYRWVIGSADLEYKAENCLAHRGWIAWKDAPPTSRHAVFYQVWSLLRELDTEQRDDSIGRIRRWAGFTEDRASARCMTADELRKVSRQSLIRIGSHTVTHPRLSQLTAASEWEELTSSKATLESILKRSIETFSYPFGDRSDYSKRTVAAVRKAGYRLACSNFEGAVGPRSDTFQLPRLHVQNWNGSDFEKWLRPHLKS